MTQLLKWVEQRLSQGRQPVTPMEKFINSKNPKSVAEVEYWTKEYQHKIGFPL
jgi:hypothetical protein